MSKEKMDWGEIETIVLGYTNGEGVEYGFPNLASSGKEAREMEALLGKLYRRAGAIRSYVEMRERFGSDYVERLQPATIEAKEIKEVKK